MIYNNRIPSSHTKGLKEQVSLPNGKTNLISNRIPPEFLRKEQTHRPTWEDDIYWDCRESFIQEPLPQGEGIAQATCKGDEHEAP